MIERLRAWARKHTERGRYSPIGILFHWVMAPLIVFVNDSLGHDTGDFILKDIARRLVSCVREVDTVSREGGDEFVVILPDLERPESARTVADKILKEVARPVEIAGHEIHITPSIGISHYPNDATDVQQLLKQADIRMYEAKVARRQSTRSST